MVVLKGKGVKVAAGKAPELLGWGASSKQLNKEIIGIEKWQLARTLLLQRKQHVNSRDNGENEVVIIRKAEHNRCFIVLQNWDQILGSHWAAEARAENMGTNPSHHPSWECCFSPYFKPKANGQRSWGQAMYLLEQPNKCRLWVFEAAFVVWAN